MSRIVSRLRLWLLEQRQYGLQRSAELRMEVLVPFTDIATSMADLAAAPRLTKRQRMRKHYCAYQLSHRATHLEHARRAHQKLIAAQKRFAELQTATT